MNKLNVILVEFSINMSDDITCFIGECRVRTCCEHPNKDWIWNDAECHVYLQPLG